MTAQTAAVDTSVAAYNDIKPKAPGIRERVLDFITNAGTVGASRSQIVTALGLNEITVGSRITELLQAGKVARKGETTLSTSGKSEHLYVVGNGIPLPKAQKEVTINQARFIEILKKLGVTSGDVDYNLYFAEQPEGADFWFAVNAALQDEKQA